MKITTTRQSLLDALLVVSRAVSARAALQALSGILITTDGGATLRATDMELGLEVGLEGEIEGGGSVVLPGRLLVEVARSFPMAPSLSPFARPSATSRSARDPLASIFAPCRRTTSRASPSRRRGRAARTPLRDTINRVARAASRDEARPVLTGVLVTVEGDEMTMVATDSYRLAVKTTKLSTSVPERLRRTSRRERCGSSPGWSRPAGRTRCRCG